VSSDPFVDEVAIDFPSMGSVVERVRDAFLAQADHRRADALKVDVQISGAQAHRGTVVSVSVPVRATCLDCGGRGETWAEPCVSCSGAGSADERSLLRVAVPPGVVDGARLSFRLRPPHAAAVHVEVTILVSERRVDSRM